MYQGADGAVVPYDQWDNPNLEKLNALIDDQAKTFKAQPFPPSMAGVSPPPPGSVTQYVQYPQTLPILIGFKTAEGAVGIARITHFGPDAPGTTIEIKELGKAAPQTSAPPTVDSPGL
jgi:hypothetical protein